MATYQHPPLHPHLLELINQSKDTKFLRSGFTYKTTPVSEQAVFEDETEAERIYDSLCILRPLEYCDRVRDTVYHWLYPDYL